MLKMREKLPRRETLKDFSKESAGLYTGARSRQRMPPWLPHEFLHAALVKCLQIFSIEQIFRRPGNNLSPVEYHKDMIAEAIGPLYVMEYHHECAALLSQFPKKPHHAELVPQVEVLQGLIKQIILWRLGKQQGNTRALAFAAGKRAERPMGEMGQIHPFYCTECDIVVGRQPAGQVADVRMPSQQDIFAHVSPEFPRFFLQQHAHMAGELAAGP